MWLDFEGEVLHVKIGDFTSPDEPRGREFTVGIDLGQPFGEFDSSLTAWPPQYGTWGFWCQLWRWGISVGIRGPILGKLPPEEDD